MLLSFLSFISSAQNRIISGKVTDSKDGSPISGVSVVAKGFTNGTVTDVNGAYRLPVNNKTTTLVFSSVGFGIKEVPVTADEINIILVGSNASLNEVVVVGYGVVRKKDLTGSVSVVNAKDFDKGAITTPEQLISGKVAGVQITSNGGAPGSGSTIRIRGGASLNASNDPLIVIDGMPLENSSISGVANPLSLINPSDIESFSVLKDASATAIYGSRASNGVIIITTKKGRKGRPIFGFNTQLSVASISKKVDVLSGAQVRQIVNNMGNSDLKSKLGPYNTDWQDQIYQTALGQDNNLSVAGGLKNLPYRVSLGFLNQDGILRTGNLQRTSLGINLSPLLWDNHLKIDINIKGTYSKSRFANEGAIGSAVSFDPTQSVTTKSNRYGGYWEWLDPTTATGLRALSPKNPVGLLNERDDRSTVQRSIGNAVIDYKLHFFPDLHAVLNLGYDVSQGTGTVVINDSAASSYNRFEFPTGSGKFHGGVKNQYKQTKQNTYLNFYFNYAKELKSIDSRVEALAGYEYQDYLTSNYYGTTPNPVTHAWTPYSDYTYDGTLVAAPTNPYDKPENFLLSYLGRVNFTFHNKYLLTGSVRRDASSKFNPSNRYGTFPSAAVAWKIKEESFLKNLDAVSDLKLRVGYGVTGQQDGIGDYDYITYYSLSNAQAQYQFGNTFYQMYRPGGSYYNRKWEQTATTNIALDYGFLNNRISGSIEYYYKKTTDLLNQIVQGAGTNFSNKIVANIGSMENKGVEFSVNIQPIRSKDLTWDVSFNATYNENKITKLNISNDPSYAGATYGGIAGGVGNTVLIQSVGHNRGAFYVYKQVYDAKTGKPIDNLFADLNRDGIVNQNDLYVYKGIDPKAFFGFSTNLIYKKWNGGFVMRANVGNYMYNNVASSTGTYRNILNPIGYINNGSSNVLESNFSGSGDKYFLSDYYVQNASFLRMDNIYAGYNAGRLFNGKTNLRISVVVQNVFVITKYKGLDPEISGGIDNNFYPRPRTFILGLNLDF
jgi:TonB-linked SusC/RagA family outer membrane protein